MLTILVYTVHVLICFFLIAVVLLQQGKGADLSVFGGGGTQTAFGARGAATVLHKMTVGSFVAFIVTTLSIGVLQGNKESGIIGGLPGAPPVEESAEEAPAEPEGALPTEDQDAATSGDEGGEAATSDAADSESSAADSGEGSDPEDSAGAGDGTADDPGTGSGDAGSGEGGEPAASEGGSSL